MANPFQQRATEYLHDTEAFLSVVSPEPIVDKLRKPAQEGRLLNRLVFVTGTPGSGKTTMARLLQLDALDALQRNRNSQEYREILSAIASCGFFENGHPVLAAIRLPLESEYRQYWELPYSPEIRTGLLMRMLQARAVLGWLRLLPTQSSGSLDAIDVIAREGADAQFEEVGGPEVGSIYDRARTIELAIYKACSALVPPSIDDLPEHATSAYEPFDVIQKFQRHLPDTDYTEYLRPAVFLDDAHVLHPEQLSALRRHLMRRELSVGRWILTRLDALTPAEALRVGDDNVGPGTQMDREVTLLEFQEGSRQRTRRSFRSVATAMANRYLHRMPSFSDRGLREIGVILGTAPDNLTPSRRARLEKMVSSAQRQLAIGKTVRKQFETDISAHLAGSESADTGMDVHLAMLSILMHRYAKRTRQRQLFDDTPAEIDEAKLPRANAGIAAAARLHLMHKLDRAFYYGVEDVRDASSDNAELFLQLTGELVSLAETRLIRGKGPELSATLQHRELRRKAREIVESWDFPYHFEVRALVDELAQQCLARSLEANASLGAGAGEIGIPQSEFDALGDRNSVLGSVLQFAVAYSALRIVRNYGQGGKTWCLLDLGGVVRLARGLTLRRGGFLERRVADLEAILNTRMENR